LSQKLAISASVIGEQFNSIGQRSRTSVINQNEHQGCRLNKIMTEVNVLD